MKLQRIKIEQLRRFGIPYEIDMLQPGLNIFTGPNGIGKSSIVRAIRAAFLERHRSRVDDLMPSDDSRASPTIELAFTLGDQPGVLRKSFNGTKRCLLQLGSTRLEGEEAEQKLAEIIGFQFSGRGASKAEHWGVPGLLWIEQGVGHELDEAVKSAADHLRGALAASVGDIASSSGDELIEQARALRSELLTGTGRPRGDYSEALANVEKLTAEQAELVAQIAGYHQQVDQLARLRAEHERDAAEQPWQSAEAEAAAAQEKLNAIEAQRRQLEVDRQQLAQCERQGELIADSLAQMARDEQQLQHRERAVQQAEAQLATARQQAERLQSEQAAAAAAYEAARQELAVANREDRRYRQQAALTDARKRGYQLATGLAAAELAARQLAELRQQAAQGPQLTAADLDRLRKLAWAQRELAIQAEAVATRVRYALAEGRELALGTHRLTGEGEQLLLAPATLALPGIGTFDIIPGGESVADLARRQEEAGVALAAALKRSGVLSVETAEVRLAELDRLRADSRDAERTIQTHASTGLEALHAEQQTLAAEVARIENELANLPPASETALPSERAEQQLEGARTALDGITQQASQAQAALARNQLAWEMAQTERDSLSRQLQAPDRRQKEQALQGQLLEQRALREELARRTQQQEVAIESARPKVLEQDIQRYRASATNLRLAFDERVRQIDRLQVALEIAGSQGLEERHAVVAAEASLAERRVAELRRRAEALDLLLNLLEEKRLELTRRLQAPLQRRLNHYLRLLFPDAAVEINEDLTLGRINRNAATIPESTLLAEQSFGTREQLALIGRLAYADLLREAGRPTHIILDDCLVHSDRERLQEMKRILFDAAERHQILLFTCHPDNWRDMGVEQRAVGMGG